jgi:anti-sigma B factor antagonist
MSCLIPVNPPLGQDPALLLKQEGAPMFSVNLSTREGDGHVVVALRGELDVADAVSVAAALAAVAARDLAIIVDLAGLDFIDSSGVAALAHGRKHARRAGGDLVLAAPQQQVLRVLTLTRLIEVFPVHASVDEAAGSAGCSQRPATAFDPGTTSSATLSKRCFSKLKQFRAVATRRRGRPRRTQTSVLYPAEATPLLDLGDL